MIETAKPMPQVVVHVVPRLLGDVLTIVLQGRRFVVSTLPAADAGDGGDPSSRSFDLAIVTDGLLDDVEAERIIVIDEDGIPTAGIDRSAIVASGEDGGLSALLALIDDLLD